MSLLLALLTSPSGAPLTGVSADVALGAPALELEVPLPGQAVSAAQGSLSPGVTVEPIGQATSAGPGQLLPEITIALTGAGVSAELGVLSASIAPDPSTGKSGVNRMWLIEYYTREFAKKPAVETTIDTTGLTLAAKRKALKVARIRRAAEIEELASRAEAQLEVLAQGIRDAQAAQRFTMNLLHEARRMPDPAVDFMQVAIEYRNKIQREDDDLLLLSMVI